MKRVLLAALAVNLVFGIQGCSKLFGDLRPDLDDSGRNQATSGGVWPERNMIDDSDLQAGSAYDDYSAVGHGERNPKLEYVPSDGRTWVDQQDGYRPTEQQVRDQAQAARARAQNVNAPKTGARVTRADFLDESQNEGSLWASSGQTNYFFTKNSIKAPGDIITVNVQDQFIKDAGAEVKRGLTEDEMNSEIDYAQRNHATRTLASANPPAPGTAPNAAPGGAQTADQTASSAAAAQAAPVDDGFKATAADVDLSSLIGLKQGDTVMAEIVERYPSGNYKIRGTKRLNFRGTARTMTFVGIVRAADITEQDTVDSGKLYEYKLSVQHP